MPAYPRQTDSVHRIRLPATIRCFWSEVVGFNDTDVWMHVETHMVADGTELAITVHRVDPDSNERVEQLGELSGSLTENAFEQQYHVQLTPEQMDAAGGKAVLVFEARAASYELVGESQRLLVKRPRFSI